MIPRTWADVTPAWMTSVLAPRFPGATVSHVELVAHDDGTNRRARFGLTYSAGAGPDVVFVKAEGEHREVHARNGNLFNEPLLAASGVELPLDHPEPYAVLVDEAGLDWLVVAEDVTRRGGDPRDSTRPLTVAQAERGVRALARLHRAFWGFTAASHPGLAWVRTWEPTPGFSSGLRRRSPVGLERAAGSLPGAVGGLSGDEVVDLWVRYVALLGREPATLLHADAHIGNTYVLPDDEVGFLDWQVTRRGNWSQDVGHFLHGAVIERDRRTAERDVLAAYLDELGRDDVGLDDAWRWYRASAVYGLAIWLATLGTDGYQPHEVSRTLVARYAAAVVDLDAVAAIAELESS